MPRPRRSSTSPSLHSDTDQSVLTSVPRTRRSSMSPPRSAPLDTDQLVQAYRWMLVARRIDDTMWTLRRQGKGHFVVSSSGHEAIGAPAGLAPDLEQDRLAPHYRDLATCLAWGLEPRGVLAHYFGPAAHPSTGPPHPYPPLRSP